MKWIRTQDGRLVNLEALQIIYTSTDGGGPHRVMGWTASEGYQLGAYGAPADAEEAVTGIANLLHDDNALIVMRDDPADDEIMVYLTDDGLTAQKRKVVRRKDLAGLNDETDAMSGGTFYWTETPLPVEKDAADEARIAEEWAEADAELRRREEEARADALAEELDKGHSVPE